MKKAFKFSDKDRLWMRAAAQHPASVIEFYGKGWARASLEKRMATLCEAGYFKPYVHGGYEITALGRHELKNLEVLDALRNPAGGGG